MLGARGRYGLSDHDHGEQHMLVLSAFGIHGGGGKVLLDELIEAASQRLRLAFIDSRFTLPSGYGNGNTTFFRIQKNIHHRFMTLLQLAKAVHPTDVLLCFNGLPPLRRAQAKTIVFVQNSYLINNRFSFRRLNRQSIRQVMDYCIFRYALRNADEIWVQTASMASAIKMLCPAMPVRTMPFVGQDTLRGAASAPPVENHASSLTYFYPADASIHKNHIRLFSAWQLLASEAYPPKLMVTLSTAEFQEMLEVTGIKSCDNENIVNLGPLSRSAVLAQLSANTTLIFPSLTESFGLPLVEASALSCPIVASELDFVRDVCDPVQTFNPLSAVSIADAVRRHSGLKRTRANLLDPTDFISELLK